MGRIAALVASVAIASTVPVLAAEPSASRSTVLLPKLVIGTTGSNEVVCVKRSGTTVLRSESCRSRERPLNPSAVGQARFLLKDANGETIGPYLDADGWVLISPGRFLNLVNVKRSGFSVVGDLSYTSTDCTGEPLAYPWDSDNFHRICAASTSTTAYCPTEVGTLVDVHSNLLLGFTDQAACDAYSPSGTFMPPHGCCYPISGMQLLAPVETLDLSGFVPPFHLE